MAKLQWIFQGRLQVEDILLDRDIPAEQSEVIELGLDGSPAEPDSGRPLQPLSKVRVEIKASSTRKGGWRFWAGTHTDQEGFFKVSRPGPDKPRRFRVRVFLDNGVVRVGKIGAHGAIVTAPIVVWTDEPNKKEEFRTDPSVYFGDIILRDVPPITRATRNHIRRAALYATLQRLREALCEQDPWLDFPKGINAVYPAGIATWAEGTRIHIVPRYYKISTVVHETMHIWNYQHNRGTTNWPGAAVAGMGTHNERESPSVAFHEGFASWASLELLHHVFGVGAQSKPYNKRWLSQEHSILSVSGLQRNDDGVASGLRLLTYKEPYRLLLGSLAATPGTSPKYAELRPSNDLRGKRCPMIRPLSLWDVLLAFRATPSAGVRKQWQVGPDSNGLLRFFDRLSRLYGDRFGTETKNLYLRVLDPRRTEEMRDQCVEPRPMRPRPASTDESKGAGAGDRRRKQRKTKKIARKPAKRSRSR